MILGFLPKRIQSKAVQIGLGCLCVLLILSADMFNAPLVHHFINRIDALIYDQMVVAHLRKYQELARVIIIDIDERSIQKEGRWPWPRDKVAALLLKLQESGVVVAGLDIVMADPEINYAIGLKEKLNGLPPELSIAQQELPALLNLVAPQVDNDAALARAMQRYDTTLGFLFHNLSDIKKGLLPHPLTNDAGKLLNADEFLAQRFHGYNASLSLFMQAAGHGGFVTNLPDSDGVIRQGLVLASYDNKVYPSLALMTAMRYLMAEHVNLKFHQGIGGAKLYGIDVAGTFIPTNARAQILIPFWGLPFTLPFYSATDMLQGKVDAKELEGAVAIVGSSGFLLGDLHPSPVARMFPGVEMVGNMVAAILGQQIWTKYNWYDWVGVLTLGLFGVIFACLFPFLSVVALILITLFVILTLVGSFAALFYFKNIYVPSALMIILVSLLALINYAYEFILEKRQKYKIKQLFEQYVPESYVKQLIDSPGVSTMEGQTRDMTVLFSDIRNFTNTSEGLDAVGVKRLLNTFFTPLTEIIFNHQGTIDKYVGDMVIAFWGAPIPIPNNGHAYQAINATLDIFNQLPAINATMIANNLPPVNIGIGLGTGLMNVGDMGSKFRRSYTVLGDVVNLASRLESLTKFYGVNCLVNDATREGQSDFLWRAVDKVAVKGRLASLTLYEPLGLLEEASADQIAEIEAYHQALASYYAKDWTEATLLFENLKKNYPQCFLYQLYLTRIDNFKLVPPVEPWDGVYIHKEK